MSGKIEKSAVDEQHEGEITSSCFYNNHFFTSGADGKIKVRYLFIANNYKV